MEKMMKKPEVEAVRFEDADVIATSVFATQKSELKQALNGTLLDTNDYYKVEVNADGGVGSYVGYNEGDNYNEYKYAWYNDATKTWGTKGWTISEHQENGGLPTGNDNQ